VIVETAVERYRFECANCGRTWNADYDVQYVQDHEGGVWSFYRLNGVPVRSPVGDDLLCAACHHGRILVRLIARRDAPAASLDRDDPRQQVTTTPDERRASAPALPATPGDLPSA
jgi:hypothetical protein